MSYRKNAAAYPDDSQILDLSKIRAGDTVWCEGRVLLTAIHFHAPHLSVQFRLPLGPPDYDEVGLHARLEDIVGHRPAPPKPIAVGDRARDRYDPYDVGLVLMFGGDYAWLRHTDGSEPCTYKIADLERVDE